MRKLASVQKVVRLDPIPGADKIETATVLGWQVVVKRGEFQVGELAVYFEIDSWVPHAIAPFLSGDKEPKVYEGVQGQRLRTVRLRKQLSQGLLLPLTVADGKVGAANEGDDLTEALGVTKWEPEDRTNGGNPRVPGSSQRRRFPAFIPKTDQARVQNIGTAVAHSLDEEFEVTMKKDGSSLTVFRVDPSSPYYNDAKALTAKKLPWWKRVVNFLLNTFEEKQPVYGICSRNLLLPLEGDSNFHKIVDKGCLFDKLDSLAIGGWSGSLALQGECVAPDIQGNYENVKDVEFHLFDIFDIDAQKYVLPLDRRAMAALAWIPHATTLKVGKLREVLGLPEGEVDSLDVVKAALAFAEGRGDNIPHREGVVFKALERDFSFKAISNYYLEKTGN